MGHGFLFDPKTLSESMRLAGFTDIQQREPSESDDPNLRNIDSHQRYVGVEFNRVESMIFEASKPPGEGLQASTSPQRVAESTVAAG
jgi:hypothetical protein